MKVCFSIAHAAHKPERRPILDQMLADIGALGRKHNWDPFVYIEDKPGKPHEWSLRQWKGVADRSDYTHAAFLNDDLILCDDFTRVLDNVIAARPAHLLNLSNCHKLAHDAQARGMSWLTSNDGLIGNAYVLPIPSLRAFLAWRESSLTDGTVETLSEDQLLNLWAMAHGCLVHHCVPSLVEHDTSVPSCYGNTQCRQAEVGPRAGMLDVNWETDALHCGRIFTGNHHALLTRVKGERGPLVKRFYELAGEALF